MILYFGDPHGEFRHIIREVRLQKPQAAILLGDIEAPLPLHKVLRPILDLTDVWFIHGNHDTDKPEYWENLYGSELANKSLHGRVCEVDGRRVAGLGGGIPPISMDAREALGRHTKLSGLLRSAFFSE